ncbi:MAG: secretin N-terminal domain-containing protein [Verrucomicrobiota bacterium]
MKHLVTILLTTFAAGWLAAAADDTTNAPAPGPPPDATAANTAPTPAPAPETPDTNLPAEPTPTNGLILNFHDAPLNAVLNYLSAKAGLIIMSDVDLRGKVSVVAKQPVTTNEIVDLLSEQLGKNNYAVNLNGRTLTIMDATRAKTSALTPVIVANGGPNTIPINDIVVTEILPVHTLNPGQLVKDLETLIPPGDTVTANDAGNAILMTASQKDIHRISEIIAALDSSAISDVEVFILKFADAKSVASELKEVFQSADSDITRANTRNTFAGRAGRGGFGGGFNPFGGGGGGGGGTDDSTKTSQTHAVFVSDDQMNAVVASTPPDYMRTVSNIVEQLDQPSQDITEIKVFHLKNADPQEIADELSTLFPSSTSSDQNSRTMGFRFGPPFMQQQSSANSQSTRMKHQTTVVAVADRRKQAVVVTASKDMMTEIRAMIADLDEGTQGVQHVFALPIDSADPASVQETMTGLFAGSGASSKQTQTQTALSAREQSNANSQSTTTTSSSSSSFGTGASGTTGIR